MAKISPTCFSTLQEGHFALITARLTEQNKAPLCYRVKVRIIYCNKNLLGSHGSLPPTRNDATCGARVPGGGSTFHISLALRLLLECVFIICPRTPTEPICSPALLSSSAAASCVVTTLRFILSPVVDLGSPGILIESASLQSLQQQPPPAFMSTEEEAPEHLCQG